jgi:hypothetical protein
VSFKVVPAHLDGYAGQLSRAAEDALASAQFLDGHQKFDGGGALIKPLAGAHEALVEQVRQNLARIRTILDADVTELRGAANFYRATDLGEAERLDATYPRSSR